MTYGYFQRKIQKRDVKKVVRCSIVTLLTITILVTLTTYISMLLRPKRTSVENHDGLAPASGDDRQMLSQLVHFLTNPNGSRCTRPLLFGGYAALQTYGMVLNLEGGQSVCLDREFSAASRRCNVYSYRNANDADRTFESAMQRFGCRTKVLVPADGSSQPLLVHKPVDHYHGPLPAAQSPQRTSRSVSAPQPYPTTFINTLNRTQPISCIAITIHNDYLPWLHHIPTNAEQLMIRLNFTPHLPSASISQQHTFKIFRNVYDSLMALQDKGFQLMAFDQLDSDGAVNMTVPGRSEPLTSVLQLTMINRIERVY